MSDGFLNSWITTWRGIAKYCGMSVDTVRRWEKQFGLPVMRLPSKSGKGPHTVTAIPSELNIWLREYSDGVKNLKALKAERKAESSDVQ